MTALMFACRDGLEELALNFLEFGAKSNSIDEEDTDNNYTAMMFAKKKKLNKVVAKIEELLANENIEPKEQLEYTDNGIMI